MIFMWVLGGLLITGITLALLWIREPYRPWPEPPPSGPDSLSARQAAKSYFRGFAVALVAGVWTGAVVTGPGIRLIMRLLAVTGGEAAQGVVTEADQTVGVITLGGSFGLIVFGGILPGLLSAIVYLLVRRWLPAGWLGGIAFGALHLLLLATRLDPLRPDNEDFDIVGPGWLSVLTFGLVCLLHGIAVVAFANRYSRELPVQAGWPGRLRAFLPLSVPLALLAPNLLIVAVPALVGLLVAQAAWQAESVVRVIRGDRLRLMVRALVGVAVLLIAPFSVADLLDILVRS